MPEEVKRLTDALERVETELKDTRRAANRRTIFTVIGITLALIVGFDGQRDADIANEAADDAKRAVELVVTQRTEARARQCATDNDTAGKINALNDRTFQQTVDVFSAPRDVPRTPDEQARVDAFIEQQRVAFEAIKVPPRDCSPEGIAEFYGDEP